MKILKISDNEGLFLTNESDYKDIKMIGKDDIYYLLNTVYENDSVEMDKCDENNDIKNPANKIIYDKIYEKVNLFIQDKTRIVGEIGKVFNGFELEYEEELQK